jgi:hypothetical protein
LSGQWEKITRVEETGETQIALDWTTGNYEIIRLECSDVQPATDQDLLIKVRQSATVQEGASDYAYNYDPRTMAVSPGGTETADDAHTGIIFSDTAGSGAGEVGQYNFTLFDPDSTEDKGLIFDGVYENNTPARSFIDGGGIFYGNATAVDGLQIESASGNIAGNCTLLGRRR